MRSLRKFWQTCAARQQCWKLQYQNHAKKRFVIEMRKLRMYELPTNLCPKQLQEPFRQEGYAENTAIPGKANQNLEILPDLIGRRRLISCFNDFRWNYPRLYSKPPTLSCMYTWLNNKNRDWCPLELNSWELEFKVDVTIPCASSENLSEKHKESNKLKSYIFTLSRLLSSCKEGKSESTHTRKEARQKKWASLSLSWAGCKKRGCHSLIVCLLVFICVCSRLCAFACM